MLSVDQLKPQDFVGLSPAAAAELAARVLAHVDEQSRQIETQAQAIEFRDAKIASITFELRRLKARQFAAKTERMNAEQRQLFEETLAAQIAAKAPATPTKGNANPAQATDPGTNKNADPNKEPNQDEDKDKTKERIVVDGEIC